MLIQSPFVLTIYTVRTLSYLFQGTAEVAEAMEKIASTALVMAEENKKKVLDDSKDKELILSLEHEENEIS